MFKKCYYLFELYVLAEIKGSNFFEFISLLNEAYVKTEQISSCKKPVETYHTQECIQKEFTVIDEDDEISKQIADAKRKKQEELEKLRRELAEQEAETQRIKA